MKQILITLLTFFTLANTHAQMKLEITPSDSKYAKMSIECKDQSKCDKKLVKWINKQRFFKGEWKTSQENSIVSKKETDIDGNEYDLYFHAENFSVELIDMTQEIADREALELTEKTERQALKQMKQQINDSNLPNWHKRILKMYIKSLRDD